MPFSSAQTAAATTAAKADGVRIIVIGIDIDPASESVLQNQIASSPEDYYPAADSSQLNAIHTSIADLLAGTTKHHYAADQRIATRDNTTLYYTLADHLGSTILVVDKNGAVMLDQDNKPIGQILYDW